MLSLVLAGNTALNSYRGNSKREKKNTVDTTCGWAFLPVPSPPRTSSITASVPVAGPVTGPGSPGDRYGTEPRLWNQTAWQQLRQVTGPVLALVSPFVSGSDHYSPCFS